MHHTPFPLSVPPDDRRFAAHAEPYDDSVSDLGQRTAPPAVALAVADDALRRSMVSSLQRAGRVSGGDDLLPIAAVVITDAKAGARQAVTSLLARTRSDATMIVVLPDTAAAEEVRAAYEAGAVLCLRTPVDEHQLLGAVGSAIDLRTAKVHADDLLRQLDVQAHLASLGRVTAGFTHEVGNPLTVLVANFDAVRTSVTSLLEARDLLSRPGQAAAAQERMARVSPGNLRDALDDMGASLERIQGVLTLARHFAQRGHVAKVEDVDLATVVRDVLRWAGGELEGVDVQQLVDEPIIARGDATLLGQVVLNLVTNAAHAARQLPAPRVRVHVYGSTETAILSVRDNGPGVPDDLRQRIFDPFFTTRRDKGGTGLGLALCREYAAQMQAELSLWTAPGRGACFRIHLRRSPR